MKAIFIDLPLFIFTLLLIAYTCFTILPIFIILKLITITKGEHNEPKDNDINRGCDNDISSSSTSLPIITCGQDLAESDTDQSQTVG